MDPQVAWEQLLAAYAVGDWDILEERATTLAAWLDRGGFPPTIIRQPDIDPLVTMLDELAWRSPNAHKWRSFSARYQLKRFEAWLNESGLAFVAIEGAIAKSCG